MLASIWQPVGSDEWISGRTLLARDSEKLVALVVEEVQTVSFW